MSRIQVFLSFFLFLFYRWLKVNSLLEAGSTLLMSPCDVSPADKATTNNKPTSCLTPPAKSAGTSLRCKLWQLLIQSPAGGPTPSSSSLSAWTVHCMTVKRSGSAIGAVYCVSALSLSLFLLLSRSLSYTHARARTRTLILNNGAFQVNTICSEFAAVTSQSIILYPKLLGVLERKVMLRCRTSGWGTLRVSLKKMGRKLTHALSFFLLPESPLVSMSGNCRINQVQF